MSRLHSPPSANVIRDAFQTSGKLGTIRIEWRLVAYTPKHLAKKILKGRSVLEGERRVVTVLFADAAGFTPSPNGKTPRKFTG
jgi:class 3 adenylate cyclase